MTTKTQAPALPAWASKRWAADSPAAWARDLWACVRVVQTQQDVPAYLMVRDVYGRGVARDWTTARALRATVVSAGGAP